VCIINQGDPAEIFFRNVFLHTMSHMLCVQRCAFSHIRPWFLTVALVSGQLNWLGQQACPKVVAPFSIRALSVRHARMEVHNLVIFVGVADPDILQGKEPFWSGSLTLRTGSGTRSVFPLH